MVNITCKFCNRRHPASQSCGDASRHAHDAQLKRESELAHARDLANALLPSHMPLRTWMATQIYAAYRANPGVSSFATVAALAVADADALIKELNK